MNSYELRALSFSLTCNLGQGFASNKKDSHWIITNHIDVACPEFLVTKLEFTNCKYSRLYLLFHIGVPWTQNPHPPGALLHTVRDLFGYMSLLSGVPFHDFTVLELRSHSAVTSWFHPYAFKTYKHSSCLLMSDTNQYRYIKFIYLLDKHTYYAKFFTLEI